MEDKIYDLQPSAQVIVMAAAVSDFKKSTPCNKKISKELFLNSFFDDIEMTPDLIKNQTSRKLENQIFLGFAAETGSDNEIKEGERKKEFQKAVIFSWPIQLIEMVKDLRKI